MSATQWTLVGGGAVMVPGFGASVYLVGGVNLDGRNSSVYIQGQVNGGLGGGAFAGWGLSGSGGRGDAPKTGFDSATYLEADAGYGPAVSVSSNLGSDGAVSSASATYPLKVGAGIGFGVMFGKSGTGTIVSPTIGQLNDLFKQNYNPEEGVFVTTSD
jgi:hypothetical protein